MKLTGDIKKITTKREYKHQDIELEIDKVEYMTNKKDGHYFQAFDYEVELETINYNRRPVGPKASETWMKVN